MLFPVAASRILSKITGGRMLAIIYLSYVFLCGSLVLLFLFFRMLRLPGRWSVLWFRITTLSGLASIGGPALEHAPGEHHGRLFQPRRTLQVHASGARRRLPGCGDRLRLDYVVSHGFRTAGMATRGDRTLVYGSPQDTGAGMLALIRRDVCSVLPLRSGPL